MVRFRHQNADAAACHCSNKNKKKTKTRTTTTELWTIYYVFEYTFAIRTQPILIKINASLMRDREIDFIVKERVSEWNRKSKMKNKIVIESNREKNVSNADLRNYLRKHRVVCYVYTYVWMCLLIDYLKFRIDGQLEKLPQSILYGWRCCRREQLSSIFARPFFLFLTHLTQTHTRARSLYAI